MKSLRIAGFVFSITALLIGAQVVEASHYRGGTMSVRVLPADAGTPYDRLVINAETLWEKGGDELLDHPLSGISRFGQIGMADGVSLFTIDFQILDANRNVVAGMFEGTLAQPDIVATTTSVDRTDPFFDIRRQQFTLDLSGLDLGFGSYILYWADAGRIDGLHNVSSDLFIVGSSISPFSLEAGFIYDGTERDTPTISSRVLTTVVQEQLYSNNLNAAGNGPLSYQLLLGSDAPRYGPTTQIPGLTVDSTGQVSIPAADTEFLEFDNLVGELGGDYVFKVVITDIDGQYIEQDVMLDVEEAPNQVCAISISDAAPTVNVAEELVLTITANDPDEEDSLIISDFPTLENSSLIQVGSNPATATWTFTPDLSQVGTQGVNFTADDDGDPTLSCVVNAQITVVAPEPEVPVSATGEEVPGVASNAKTGSSLAGCGNIHDVAGGGTLLGDILAGAPGYEEGVLPVEAGAAVLYFGSTDEDELVSPDIIFTGEAAYDRVGTSVSCFDVPSMSFPVLIIGAEQIDRISDPAVPTGNGKVYVILFNPLDGNYPNIADPDTQDIVSLALVGQAGGIAGWVFEGDNLGDQAGFCTAGGCDLNGGGGPEIIIGAPSGDNLPAGPDDAGVVYVLHDLSGIATSTTPISLGLVGNTIPGIRYEGDQTGAQLGYACACVGDVIGSSADDLAMSAPFHDVNPKKAGETYIVPGGEAASGIIETCDIGTGTTSGSRLQGDQEDENLGTSISGGSLIVGSPYYDPDPLRTDAGRVIRATAKLPDGMILSASSIGDPDPGNPDSQPGAIYHGEETGDGLGVAVAGLFDVTNDGVPDFAMGAPFADVNPSNAGKTYVVEGTGDTSARSGIIETCDIGTTQPGRSLEGSQDDELSGSTIANTGDVNGNPSNDFAIGAPFKDVSGTEIDAGTLYLVLESDNLGVDNVIPVARAGADQVPACFGNMATASLDGSASTDGDSTPGTNDDIMSFAWSEGGLPLAGTEHADVAFTPGTHEVVLTVTDFDGETSSDTMMVNACPLTLDLEKVEIDWPKQNETRAKIKIHGSVALPGGTQPHGVDPLGVVAMDIADQADVLAETIGLDVFGSNNNKWDYKNLPPSMGVGMFAIHWDGASFDYQDVVQLKTEFIGITETLLSVSQEDSNHAIVLEVNGVTATIGDGVCTVVPDTVPCEVDEDGEVTVTLPFELLPEMEINLTIGTWAPSLIPVADHYGAANGKFMLNALVEPDGLSGDSRPATVEFRMKLGSGAGFPGSVSMTEDEWKKLSTNEWKGDPN